MQGTSLRKVGTFKLSSINYQEVLPMKNIAAVFAVVIAITSSFAMAEVDRNSMMQHDYSTAEGRQALKVLLESGDVLSVSPMGGKSVVGRSSGRVQPYEIKIRTPDGLVHSVEFRSVPVGINNG